MIKDGKSRWRLVVAVLMLALAMVRPAAAETRIALVIGNADYKDAPLRNPVNDARDIASKLRAIGFDVILRENSTKQEMEDAIGSFGERLKDGAVAMVFYSGHGMQVDGRNFLIPVDARISTEPQVRLQTVDVDVVLDQMAAAHSRVNLVILDACRNNPFEHKFRGLSGGLAQINAPEGTMIAYATAPGKVASDGEGQNGLYTEELLKAIDQPGLPIEEVFKHVRSAVMQRSSGAQTPWEASSLTGDFYFKAGAKPEPASAAAVTPPPGVDKEALFWESVKGSHDPAPFKAYLDQYPKGTFAELAAIRISELMRAAPHPDDTRSPAPVSETAQRPVQQPNQGPNPGVVSPPPAGHEPAKVAMTWPEGPGALPDRLRARAEAGYPHAQLLLGHLYEAGRQVPQDVAEAARWYRRAADQGEPLAMVALGHLLRAGRGVPKDDSQALALFRKAAAMNNPAGTTALASMLIRGTGGVVAADPTEAVRLFRLAANQHNPHAQFALGLVLEAGIDVKQDFAEAVTWFRAAADQGLPEAYLALGRACETGHGLPRDRAEAVKWYRLAATKGNPRAVERLAKLNGEGALGTR